MINYLYWGLFLIGGTLLYFAFRAYSNTVSLMQEGIKTTATVIEMIPVSSSDGGPTYKPVFEFNERGNTVRRYTSSVSSSPPAYKVGQKVKIVYDPKDKDDVKTISFWGLYRWSVILSCIAAPFLIIGGSYLLYSRI